MPPVPIAGVLSGLIAGNPSIRACPLPPAGTAAGARHDTAAPTAGLRAQRGPAVRPRSAVISHHERGPHGHWRPLMAIRNAHSKVSGRAFLMQQRAITTVNARCTPERLTGVPSQPSLAPRRAEPNRSARSARLSPAGRFPLGTPPRSQIHPPCGRRCRCLRAASPDTQLPRQDLGKRLPPGNSRPSRLERMFAREGWEPTTTDVEPRQATSRPFRPESRSPPVHSRYGCDQSGWRDSNPRPPAPKSGNSGRPVTLHVA